MDPPEPPPGPRPWGTVVRWGGLLLALLAAWTLWLAIAQSGAWDGTRIGGARFPDSASSGGVRIQTMVDPSVGPLHKDDRVLAIDGEAVESWMTSHRGRRFEAGDQLTYSVRREGKTRDLKITLHPYGWAAALRHMAVLLVAELGLLVVAVIVVARRRHDPAARIMLAVAILIPFGFPSWPLKGQVLDLAQAPWPLWPQFVSSCVWAVVLGALIPHFALVFPRPPERLPHPRLVIGALYAAPFVAHAVYLAATLSAAGSRLEQLERVSTVWQTAQLYAPLLIIVLMAWAYRRTAGTPDRDRVKLVAAALLVAFAVNIIVVQIPLLSDRNALVPTQYWAAPFLLVPLAVGVAIARHHLFDITVVWRRSVLAAGILSFLGAVYLASLWLLGPPGYAQFRYFLVGIGAALVLPPLYRWLRRHLERHMYGARGHPSEVIEEIVALEVGEEPDEVLERLAAMLSKTLRLPYVSVTLVEGDRTFEASHGTPQGVPVRILLTLGEETVGHVDLDVGQGREPFGRTDRELLAVIATHTSKTLQTAMLNVELRKSRSRLLTSREEERRRIRRDLHDGVQPSLALLAMNLEVIRDLLGTDPAAACDLIDTAQSRAHEAMSEVRRTVNDLKPTLLDELGLDDALRILATRTSDAHRRAGHELAVACDLESNPNADGVPAAVEVAAYRIVSEAVNNVSKHSEATECTIRIRRHEGLQITITDNGKGIPEQPRTGTGLGSIRERAAELGGSASIRPDLEGGTRVSATLPY